MRASGRPTTKRSAATTRKCARTTRTTTRRTRLRAADEPRVTREEGSSRVTANLEKERLARGAEMREREAKLLVSPEFRFPALDRFVDGVRVASDERLDLC